MKRDVIMPASKFNSSFLSCEKDFKTILRKLFVESKPFSDQLIKLLVINTKDCLDDTNSTTYQNIVNDMNLVKLREQGYIKLEPKLIIPEHEEVKSYIILEMNNFSPNRNNPQFRDCNVSFNILCHTDYWDIGDLRIRPLKIAGYIDGILDNSRLSGIGTFQFLGCSELLLDEQLSGYKLIYRAIHGSDDRIPADDDE